MVSEMRVPSSSSSSSDEIESVKVFLARVASARPPTNGDGLDLDALLDVCDICVVRLLVLEHLLAAERVHEGGPS